MAFCTNCGSTMDSNAHFCTKCGKAVLPAGSPAQAAAPAPTYTAPAQPVAAAPAQTTSGGSNVVKIILVILTVFIILGVISAAGVLYAGYKFKQKMRNGIHVTQNGDTSVVETPFGSATTTKTDAASAARKMGVDVYPGAHGLESSSAQFGKMTTVTAKLRTSDSVDQVAQFYKSRYPNAIISSTTDKFSMVNNDKDGTLTISAENSGDGTRIEIAKIGGMKLPVTSN